MKSSEILRVFVGEKCTACGRGKQKNTGFCGHCYHRLPKEMQSALWRRFGEGFEEAFDAAAKWLSDHMAQRSLPL